MSWPQRPTRRIPGPTIDNMRMLTRALDMKRLYIVYGHKIYHPRVIANWSFARLSELTKAGALRVAILNPKAPGRADDSLEAEYFKLYEERVARDRFRDAQASREVDEFDASFSGWFVP